MILILMKNELKKLELNFRRPFKSYVTVLIDDLQEVGEGLFDC